MSAIARGKTSKMSRWRGGGHESICISEIKRVRNNGSLFQSFLKAFFAGEGRGGVSVIASCPRGESRL